MTDQELLCLAAAQHLLGIPSERNWMRYAHKHLAAMFPNLPGHSGWGKRLRNQSGLISAAMTALTRDIQSWNEDLRLLDSTPVPYGMSWETVKRSDLSGHAGYGHCASHSRFLWGFLLYLISTPEGMPVIWGLANPEIGEREVTRALLEHDQHLIHSGQLILGDKGLAGREFEQFITEDLGATLICPDRKGEEPRFGNFGGIRQWIESVFDTLKGQLTLEQHGRRTLGGVDARVAARLFALAAGIWHNWRINAPRKRSLIAYGHYMNTDSLI